MEDLNKLTFSGFPEVWQENDRREAEEEFSSLSLL